MSTRGTALPPIDEVQDAIEDVAAQLDCAVSPDAMNYLLEPASEFFAQNPSVIPLDDARLREQLRELFRAAAKPYATPVGQTLTRADFDIARQFMACHYLWFC